MPRGVRKVLPGADSAGGSGPRDWKRFWIVCGLFLLYESVLILVFGDYFFPGVISELGVWAMIGVAALGYVLLGANAGAPASVFVTPLPVLVAWVADSPIPAEAWGAENFELYQKWIISSFIYIPAWVLGFLASLMADDKRNGRIRRR
jgi:hypothetical protein